MTPTMNRLIFNLNFFWKGGGGGADDDGGGGGAKDSHIFPRYPNLIGASISFVQRRNEVEHDPVRQSSD